ncbi:hypothetical protein [Psychrobacillus vulpis]|uniref:Uncharacterized protein n=1 Tax=Psychrobacillus vulpis TaxID=2325572 RepID=A0A544TNK6_9BACI|nr:hypothetical protein [Psychrobacillus vulpis]TQR19007.1 hypothetical protein FG384_14385 [Psychrobacillus vulpis]
MLFSIAILLIVTVILLFEIPNLSKKNYTKDIWAFSILLLIGTSLSIALAFQVKIPNPLDMITFVLQPLSDLIMKPLK